MTQSLISFSVNIPFFFLITRWLPFSFSQKSFDCTWWIYFMEQCRWIYGHNHFCLNEHIHKIVKEKIRHKNVLINWTKCYIIALIALWFLFDLRCLYSYFSTFCKGKTLAQYYLYCSTPTVLQSSFWYTCDLVLKFILNFTGYLIIIVHAVDSASFNSSKKCLLQEIWRPDKTFYNMFDNILSNGSLWDALSRHGFWEDKNWTVQWIINMKIILFCWKQGKISI